MNTDKALLISVVTALVIPLSSAQSIEDSSISPFIVAGTVIGGIVLYLYLGRRKRNQASELDSEIKEIQKQLREIYGEEEKLQEQEDETEEEEQEGQDPGTLGNEIGLEIKELESVESDVATVERELEKVLEDVEKEEEDIARKESEIEKQLKQVESVNTDIIEVAKDFIRNLDRLKTAGTGRKNVQRDAQKVVSEGLETLKDLEKENQKLRQILKILQEEEQVSVEEKDVKKALKELKNNILPGLFKEIDELQRLEEELKDEEVKAANIAKKYQDEKDWEKIQAEEKETKKAIKKAEKIINEKKDLEEEVEKELQKLKKEDSERGSELQEIEKILEKESAIEKTVEKIEVKLGDDLSQYSKWLTPGGPGEDNLAQRFENEIKNIEARIRTMKELIQEISEEYQELQASQS